MSKKEILDTHKSNITFLNCYGDLTVAWDEKDAQKMESRIQKLLDEGFQFFIVKKRFFVSDKKIPIRSLRDLEKNEITADDKTIAKLFHDIDGEVYKVSENEYDVVKGSKDPKEIVKSEVVCAPTSSRG